MQRSNSLTLAAICLLSCAVHAQTTASADEEDIALLYGDKSTVSIATGNRQSLRRAPAVATVITAQDIAAMGATDLDEVLETVPGIHVSRNNQSYNPLYVIRGIYSELNPQTLVLLNGVPLTTLLVGNRGIGWGGLPVDNIARVEVIRGPGSALYGADAFSGVVNIITKGPADISGTEFGARMGSFKTRDGWVQYGGKAGDFDLAGYLRLGKTEGYRRVVESDAQTVLDGLFGTSASLAPGSVEVGHDDVDASVEAVRDKLRLRVNYKLRSDLGSGAGVSAAIDPVGRHRSERFEADFGWNDLEIGRDWRLGFTGSLVHYTQRLSTPVQLFPAGAFGGAFPEGMFGAPNTWERHLRLSTVASYTGLSGHNLRLGLGRDEDNLYKTQEFKNFTIISSGPLTGQPTPTPGAALVEFPVADSFLTPHRREVIYAYAQDEWSLAKDWTLTAGVRHDHYSDVGGTTNPRLALVWDANLDVTAKLLYGQAFRAPAFAELYSINNPVYRGNANLKPETIRTFEAAFSWQARAQTQVHLSLFRYAMGDIIRTADAGAGTLMFTNLGAQHGHGLELEAIHDATHNLRLSGHYAFQKSTDDSTGQDAGYAPRHHVYGRADWSFSSARLLSAQLNHVAGRRRAADDLRPPVADYTTLDLTLRTNRGKAHWDFAASVRNVFDADVREPSLAPGNIRNDLPMAPRALWIQAVYRL